MVEPDPELIVGQLLQVGRAGHGGGGGSGNLVGGWPALP